MTWGKCQWVGSTEHGQSAKGGISGKDFMEEPQLNCALKNGQGFDRQAWGAGYSLMLLVRKLSQRVATTSSRGWGPTWIQAVWLRGHMLLLLLPTDFQELSLFFSFGIRCRKQIFFNIKWFRLNQGKLPGLVNILVPMVVSPLAGLSLPDWDTGLHHTPTPGKDNGVTGYH